MAFREKFGREAGPDDPVFFDPDASEPKLLDLEQVQNETIQAMVKAGIDPAIIYAHRRTGLIVSTENQHLISPEDLEEWYAAVAEYREKPKGKPS